MHPVVDNVPVVESGLVLDSSGGLKWPGVGHCSGCDNCPGVL